MRSKSKILVCALTLMMVLSLALSGCGAAKTDVLRVGMEVGYPPMEMVDEKDGKTVVGYDVDTIKEISKRLGKKDIEIVDTAWDGIFAALETKKFDVLISSVSINDERQEKYSLTNAYVANRQVLVVKKGTEGIKSPDDVIGKKLGLQGGTTAEDYIKDEMIANGKNVEYTPYQKVTQAFSDLKVGRTDAVLVDLVVAGYYLVQDKESFEIVWESPNAEPMAITFRKDDTEMRDKVNKILEEMQADGTAAKISEKWFSKDITK